MDVTPEKLNNAKKGVASAGPFDLLGELERYSGLMSVEEVASLFRVSKFTVYRMVQRRQIPSLIIGGSRRFDPKSLSFWLRKKDSTLAAAMHESRMKGA